MPVRRASDRAILAIAVALAIVIPTLVFAHVRAFLAPPRQADVYAAALSAFATGGYADIVRHNAALVDWSRRSNWALVGFVGGRFLLGYWAGRRGLLRDPAAHRVLLTRVLQVSLALGIALSFLQETLALLKASVPFLAAGRAACCCGWRWLARRRYGPMEWLWRSLTYGSLQPLRIAR